MSLATYVAIDTETGGIERDKYSLLTACFDVMDKDLNEIESLHLRIRDDPYRINPEAMIVNKIDLLEHDKTAIHKSEAGNILRKYLRKHSQDGAIKLVPIGHGVSFDVIWIHEHLLNRNEFEKYTSYRKLDTSMIAQFYKLIGLIPDNTSGSLESLCAFYNIVHPGAHDARNDNLATVAVLKAMCGVMRAMNLESINNRIASERAMNLESINNRIIASERAMADNINNEASVKLMDAISAVPSDILRRHAVESEYQASKQQKPDLKPDLPHVCLTCNKPVPNTGRMVWNNKNEHIGYVCSNHECSKHMGDSN
jgi:DNA polymerase III alpha subunit (gram-positive type)